MQPDPEHWERGEVLSDGTHVLVRPLRHEDAALYPDFVAAVTPEDSRMRFFTPLRELSEHRIEELTHLDPERAIAFLALDEAMAKMLGVVRLHLDDRKGGEYAVIVRSALKGRGLGWLLMHHLIDYAKAAGLERVYGYVLAENAAMLRMCAALGFRITMTPRANIKLATLALNDKA